MKQIVEFLKKRPEIIIAIILLLIVIVFLKSNMKQKQDLQATIENFEREKYYSDSIHSVLDSVSIAFSDTLSQLDYQIVSLQNKIEDERAKKIYVNERDIAKLEQLIQVSKKLIGKHQSRLELIKNEPRKSEITHGLLADLLESMIENIRSKQIKINELEQEVFVLKTKLNTIKQEKAIVEAESEELKGKLSITENELKNANAINENLLNIEFAIGKRKHLLKEKVLVKPFLKKQIYIGNTASPLFKKIQLRKNVQTYVLSDSVSMDPSVNTCPELKGALLELKGNVLELKITNEIEFLKTKQFVVYY